MTSNQSERDVGMATIVGTGTMGPGIAQMLAQHGVGVQIYDIEHEQLQKARDVIDRNVKLMQEAGFISQDEAHGIGSQIKETQDLNAAVDGVDLVIEAIPEVLELKTAIFADLDACCSEKTILASNTSGLSITALANATRRPGKVVGIRMSILVCDWLLTGQKQPICPVRILTGLLKEGRGKTAMQRVWKKYTMKDMLLMESR